MADELDVFLRHQAYLEGYKNGETKQTESMLEEISAVIILLLNKLGVERLSELRKRDHQRFVTEVNKRVLEIFGKSPTLTVDRLREFMAVDLRVQTKAFNELGTRAVPPLDGGHLIAENANAIVAGVGSTPSEIMAIVATASLADIRRLLTSDYANNATIAETIRAIVGTRANNLKDGYIAKLRRQIFTAIETLIQHSSAFITYKLGSMIADRYQWISVLDSRTTDICRERSGNIFVYGEGPRPPAHYRCRSTIIPVFGEARELPTYFDWIRAQPQQIQIDVIGDIRANALREGRLRAQDLGNFDGMGPLTLEQFETRSRRMLSGVE